MLIERLRNLPYQVHTNRELGLMLAGIKPLASFVDEADCFPVCVARYIRLFDKSVRTGRISRMDHHFERQVSGKIRRMHRILFALPGEEWRMSEYIELMDGGGPWTKEHERREGELLGYEDWMNDYWIQHMFR